MTVTVASRAMDLPASNTSATHGQMTQPSLPKTGKFSKENSIVKKFPYSFSEAPLSNHLSHRKETCKSNDDCSNQLKCFRHHDRRQIHRGLCMEDITDCSENGRDDCKAAGEGAPSMDVT